jgi:hypothetical protein
MECPECGAENPESAAYCQGCAVQLPERKGSRRRIDMKRTTIGVIVLVTGLGLLLGGLFSLDGSRTGVVIGYLLILDSTPVLAIGARILRYGVPTMDRVKLVAGALLLIIGNSGALCGIVILDRTYTNWPTLDPVFLVFAFGVFLSLVSGVTMIADAPREANLTSIRPQRKGHRGGMASEIGKW